tara:strand:- start:1259 stop:1468 length:210 start_codon:yes stop_codon:yes gene_type:complete
MKRFPKSKGKIQAVQLWIMKYCELDAESAEEWLKWHDVDSYGDPIVCTVEDLEWAEDYVWERCQKIKEE